MSFKNKVVLITGGIGAITAIQFAKRAATVAIVGRNEDKLKNVAKSCEDFGNEAFAIKADISKDDEANKIIEKTIEKFGKLDVLVNNAGILRKSGILDKNFLQAYDEVIATNLRAVVRLTYFSVLHIIKTQGNIINVSSVAVSCVKRPQYIAYRTSKASLNHFIRSTALELSEYGVRITTVSPGPVKTDYLTRVTTKLVQLQAATALKRFSEPEEVADLIVFLASDKAKGITDANYIIDNGLILK